MMKRHPNKHIQAAIEYALKHGFTFVLGRGHCFGVIRCGVEGGVCHKSVWSTPRSPEDHAKDLIRVVNRCRCGQ